jgi:hypothetical protein
MLHPGNSCVLTTFPPRRRADWLEVPWIGPWRIADDPAARFRLSLVGLFEGGLLEMKIDLKRRDLSRLDSASSG